MEKEIINLINKHYKTTKVEVNYLDDKKVTLSLSNMKYAVNIAARLLKKYKTLEYVVVEYGWDTWVYTRNTIERTGKFKF